MATVRYDVMVVGAGPAGSVAALVLARAGARVALVDKTAFPRDKACGDLIGPRGVQVLDDLGLLDRLPPARRVGDLEVTGPSGRRVVLPSSAGATYPGFGLAIPRRLLDAALRDAAVEAGAAGLTGRAASALFAGDGSLEGFRLEGGSDGGREIRADVVIGADGALTRVGAAAGLVDEARVLWGFAVRAYVEDTPALPRILFWEPERWRGYPGYGWVFPGADGAANVGIGLGVRADRRAATRVSRDLDVFAGALRAGGGPAGGGPAGAGGGPAGGIAAASGWARKVRLGAKSETMSRESHPTSEIPPNLRRRGPSPGGEEGAGSGRLDGRLGGWLKMGMVGTVAARGRVLLVGDAAGLVNPLQGEGISQALGSGRAAASAVVAGGPSGAAARYQEYLAGREARHASTTAPVTAWMLTHPRMVAQVGRALTLPGVGGVLAGGWSLYWNDLLDGAGPVRGRRLAALADSLAWMATRPTEDHRSVWSSLTNPPSTGISLSTGVRAGGGGPGRR